MASYPPEWETDVVLADGATLHLRPIRPEDHDALNELFGRLSEETIHFRFFTPLKELSETWLKRLTTIDYDDRIRGWHPVPPDLLRSHYWHRTVHR